MKKILIMFAVTAISVTTYAQTERETPIDTHRTPQSTVTNAPPTDTVYHYCLVVTLINSSGVYCDVNFGEGGRRITDTESNKVRYFKNSIDALNFFMDARWEVFTIFEAPRDVTPVPKNMTPVPNDVTFQDLSSN